MYFSDGFSGKNSTSAPTSIINVYSTDQFNDLAAAMFTIVSAHDQLSEETYTKNDRCHIDKGVNVN